MTAPRTASPIIGELIRAAQRKRMEGMKMIMQRQGEFPDSLSALLTGIALDPNGREFADDFLSKRFRNNSYVPFGGINTPELIIGSGFHAAVYASTRVAAGFPAPVIVESASRVGGTFAVGNGKPVFYLNSRNRKGDAGLAGDDMANLNYLPGAPIQASNISTTGYQTNAEMAFTIRLALAQSGAKILTDQTVTSVERLSSNGYDVTLGDNSEIIRTYRIIDARGLGEAKSTSIANGVTVLTFPQFMAKMSTVWPLRGITRAAVIGTGDSARCAVESLLGLAPQPFMAAAELDTVARIDWYGEGIGATSETFCRTERARYRPIARYLKADAYGNKRLNVFNNRALPMPLAGSKALIDGRSYDLVIMATGNDETRIPGLGDADDYESYAPTVKGGQFRDRQDPIARRYYGERGASSGRFRIGPHARLEFTSKEIDAGIGRIPNNRVAMFRLATKTATLATTLGPAERPI